MQKRYFVRNCVKPGASDSLKEARDKDSSLAAALKNGGFQPDALQRCYFVLKYAKPGVSDSLKETRDKNSSLAAALKTAVFSRAPSKGAALWRITRSRLLPILSNRPEIMIPAWRQL